MRIREIRRARNLTQKELADKVGVSYSVISRYEGEKIVPPSDKLELMAEVLGVTVGMLMGKEPVSYDLSFENLHTYLPQDGESIAKVFTTAERKNSAFTALDEDKLIISDSDVSHSVLEDAKGICELCGNPAPFNRRDGTPYLETHYIVWRSRGGLPVATNVVALCPNCHHRIHELGLEEDIKKLKEKAATHTKPTPDSSV